jgi:hypothetical protein
VTAGSLESAEELEAVVGQQLSHLLIDHRAAAQRVQYDGQAMLAPSTLTICRYLRQVRERGGACSDAKANRNVWDFGLKIAHDAVSRFPPISLYTIEPVLTCRRTTPRKFGDLSIVEGPTLSSL